MQWEMSKLEKELSDMDRIRMFDIDQDVHNGSFRYDDEDRKEILTRIVEGLKEYCMFGATTYS